MATQVFEYSIPHLKAAGVHEYLLEVLQHNTGAVSVYRKLGFEVTREFYYYRSEAEKISRNTKTIDFPCTIEPIDITEHDSIPGFWDFRPSWQNSTESINRVPQNFACLGAFVDNRLIGYGFLNRSQVMLPR